MSGRDRLLRLLRLRRRLVLNVLLILVLILPFVGRIFYLLFHFRRLMKLPPFYALANVIITGKSAEKAKKNAEKAARHLEAVLSGDARMLGPAPAPLYRLRNIYRHQIILKDRSRLRLRSSLQKALQTLYASRYRQQDITIDIDPYHLM